MVLLAYLYNKSKDIDASMDFLICGVVVFTFNPLISDVTTRFEWDCIDIIVIIGISFWGWFDIKRFSKYSTQTN